MTAVLATALTASLAGLWAAARDVLAVTGAVALLLALAVAAGRRLGRRDRRVRVVMLDPDPVPDRLTADLNRQLCPWCCDPAETDPGMCDCDEPCGRMSCKAPQGDPVGREVDQLIEDLNKRNPS